MDSGQSKRQEMGSDDASFFYFDWAVLFLSPSPRKHHIRTPQSPLFNDVQGMLRTSHTSMCSYCCCEEEGWGGGAAEAVADRE
jgi:hypothetical protein